MPLKLTSPAAMAPFFQSAVALTATRPDGIHRGTIAACISDEGFEEAFDEVGTSTKIGKLTIVVRKCDWYGCLKSDPQSGDQFKSPNTGRTYALKDVTSFAMDSWAIAAREVAAS